MSPTRKRKLLSACVVMMISLAPGCGGEGEISSERAATGPTETGGEVCSLDCPPRDGLCDDGVLVSYPTNGLVTSECRCDYSEVQVETRCEEDERVCLGDECVSLCAEASCPEKAPQCEGSVRVLTAADGRCDWQTGACDYSEVSSRVDCTESERVCQEGECVETCREVSCDAPAPICEGELLLTFSGQGELDGGCSCDYSTVTVTTDCRLDNRRCREGSCVDLCEGVTCPLPPEMCEGDLLRGFEGEGVCDPNTGACDYTDAMVTRDCAATGERCEPGGCVASSCPPSGPFSATVGGVIPDVTLPDCEGELHSLHDLCANKASWISGYAEWCPSCRNAARNANALYERFEAESFEAFFVVTQDQNFALPGASFCQEVRSEYGLGMTVLFDINGDFVRELGISANDYNIVVREGGEIVFIRQYAASSVEDTIAGELAR